MRIIGLLTCVLFAAACGDNDISLRPDGQVSPDGPATTDSGVDTPPDSTPDGPPDGPAVVDGIAAVRAAADGAVDLDVTNVTVTYVKPALGNPANDPAGFTIQSAQTGPAIFVAVDATTLTPPLVPGDVVSFTVTMKGSIGMSPRALAIADLVRHSQGANLTALAQNVSAATDLLSAVDTYDAELVTVTGDLASAFQGSGTGFQRAQIDTAGVSGSDALQFRVPATVVDAIDLANGCTVTATNVTVGRFTNQMALTQAQIGVFSASEITLTGCDAPVVASATALSSTSVRLTFSRRVLPTSVNVDGSQFTLDNGATVTAAVVDGRTVTLTTSAQTAGTTYTATVATSVTDLQGTALGTPSTATFAAFAAPATLKINELNANIANGCDLIELRATAAGSIAGFVIKERVGNSGELTFTLPSVNVAVNDLIVLHVNSGNATCNPGTAVNETTKNSQPQAMYGANYDTAFDFWSDDTGLTNTDNVITLFDPTAVVHDAVFLANSTSGTAANGSKNAAAIVGVAMQWDPAMATYTDAAFRTNAVLDLDGTAATAAGTSIQRVDNTDDNNVGDWTTGVGTTSTFGALNAGQ